MVKKLMTLAAALMCIFAMSAQELPLNPNVKAGVLPNGLHYYILHNELPKERANFYIAQKVGSTLETPEQLGLAHFLEHMAFNGTKNFPGKDMLNYLQNKGIRFGADINAYTGFDETVYNINNVPTTDQALMDSVLLVLHDWSCDLTLADEEINAERGVIQEEWRSRNNANTRLYTNLLPAIYEEYQYRQMPIGSMDVVMNFDPETLRAYYHKWYRPDQQGIVIVGDFDADAMEQKVKDMFSPIPMPENAAERTYPSVSDNKEPIYFEFQDPELSFSLATLSFKSDKIPFEERNTINAYYYDLIENLVSMLINNRLDEYSKKAECKYAQAGVDFGDFYVSKTKDAFSLSVIGKGNIKEALDEALAIVSRACSTGFTDSELERVKDDYRANIDRVYNERNTTKSEPLAREIIRHFIDNEPTPGIEYEKAIVDANLPNVTVQLLNSFARALMTDENRVLVVATPTSEGQLPGKDVMLADINNIMGAEYEAYVDEVITDPLVPQFLPAGKVASAKPNAKFGTTEYTLSNGVKVIVKPTDYASDEILLYGYRLGGKQIYPTSQANNLDLLDNAIGVSKVGNFKSTTLTKYLAGKNVSLNYTMGNYTNTITGNSTVKDFETLLELLYAYSTMLEPDQEAYDGFISQTRPQLELAEKNPMYIFQKEQVKSLYGGNPMSQVTSIETLNAANYLEMVNIARASMSNAADYTFVLVGNIDESTLTPLLEKYVASLPSTGKADKPKVVTPINIASGKVENVYKQPMQVPSSIIFNLYSGSLPYSFENNAKIELLGEILSNIFTETIREEDGASYSPYAYGYMNPNTDTWMLTAVIQTNNEFLAKSQARATEETMKLLKNGATPEMFNKAKEAQIKQLEINQKTNKYWMNNLVLQSRGWDTITNSRAILDKLTLKDFNKFLSKLWDGKNFINVTMDGVEDTTQK